MSGSPSQFQIDFVEQALIALLVNSVTQAYGSQVDVNSVNSKDFNAQGQLTLKAPALRVQFGDASFNKLHDNQRLSYQAALFYDILCWESSLRSKADERLQTLGLVDVVLNQLAGARLALSDGTSSMPVELKRVSLVLPNDGGPVDQLFAITIIVEGIAQYNGPNARFGS